MNNNANDEQKNNLNVDQNENIINNNQTFNVNKSIVATAVNVSEVLNTNNNIDSQSIVMPNFSEEVTNNENINIPPQELNSNTNEQINNNNDNIISNITKEEAENNSKLYDTSSEIFDKVEIKPKKNNGIKINKEFLTIILIALVLLICMLFIPNIFDLLDKLRNKFMG